MDAELEQRARDAAYKLALIDKLMHENALLKQLTFAAQGMLDLGHIGNSSCTGQALSCTSK